MAHFPQPPCRELTKDGPNLVHDLSVIGRKLYYLGWRWNAAAPEIAILIPNLADNRAVLPGQDFLIEKRWSNDGKFEPLAVVEELLQFKMTEKLIGRVGPIQEIFCDI